MTHDIVIFVVGLGWALSNLYLVLSNEKLSRQLERTMESNKRVIVELLAEVDRLKAMVEAARSAADAGATKAYAAENTLAEQIAEAVLHALKGDTK